MGVTDVSIINYSQVKPKQIEDFLLSMSNSMLYHSISYLNFISDLLHVENTNHLVAVNSKGEVVGFLPLFIKQGKYGKVINSSPFYGSNGGEISSSLEVSDLLVKEYNNMIIQQDVASATWVENLFSERDVTKLVVHSITDFRIGQYTKLELADSSEEALMAIFHYKTRNMVRKAMKSGFSVNIENTNFDFLMNTHFENLSAIGGKAKPKEFFEKIIKHFVPDKDYKIWVARYNGEPVGALLLFYYRDTVEYYTPVVKEDFRDKQPLSLLIYEAMKAAFQAGFKVWNWGGTWTSQGGVYTFKKRWGTLDKHYNYFIQVNKNEIYGSTKEILLNEYDNFFVVPFNTLNPQVI